MYEHSPKKGRRKIVSREHLLNIGFFFGEKLGFDVDRDHSSGIFSGFIHGLEANSITFRWVPMAMSGDVGMWFVWMADGWLDRWVLCISIELTNHVFLTSGQPHHFYFTAAGGNMKETRMIIHLKRRFLKLDIESWLQGPLLFFTFGVDCFAKCFFFVFGFWANGFSSSDSGRFCWFLSQLSANVQPDPFFGSWFGRYSMCRCKSDDALLLFRAISESFQQNNIHAGSDHS